MVWPKEVAPFPVHLISISGGQDQVIKEADRLYDLLTENDIEVLYDDRDARAGEKFVDADLIGIPTRVIVSQMSMQEGGVEVSTRGAGNATMVSESEIVDHLQK